MTPATSVVAAMKREDKCARTMANDFCDVSGRTMRSPDTTKTTFETMSAKIGAENGNNAETQTRKEQS
jgi:hypothetical protein